MKKYLLSLSLLTLLIAGCKTEKKSEVGEPEKELSVLEKLAMANGYENWNKVEELRFTFNVDRDTSHFERSWIWNRKTNEVTGTSLGETSTYNRGAVDSTNAKVDAAFINDKYWLLAPINVLWDEASLTATHEAGVLAPMSKDTLQKLTVVYDSEGGYTPGDAYDFYFGEDHMVKEWVFRKANTQEPTMTTSWEDYTEAGGLKIAKMHSNEDGSFKLYFTNLEIKTR
ncbi:MAG: hypothetical protein AB3N14_19235 [Flavobacteriaceae bacterium]